MTRGPCPPLPAPPPLSGEPLRKPPSGARGWSSQRYGSAPGRRTLRAASALRSVVCSFIVLRPVPRRRQPPTPHAQSAPPHPLPAWPSARTRPFLSSLRVGGGGGGGGGGGAPQNSTAIARGGGPPPARPAPRRTAPPRAARAAAAHVPGRQAPAPRGASMPPTFRSDCSQVGGRLGVSVYSMYS